MKIGQNLRLNLLRKFLATEVTEDRTFFVLTLLTGLLAGIIAVSLQYSIEFLTNFFKTNEAFTLRSFCLGGLGLFISGFLTTRFFKKTEGSGIPGVRISLAAYHGQIKIKDTIAKFFISILSLASGLSLGREGPTVTITSGIGSFLGNYCNMSKKRIKGLVAIGAAGGISAAFHTPISAVVFTLEEVVGDLNAKILGSIIISSVLATVTAQYLTGENTTFSWINYHLNSSIELILYFFLGLLCATIGPLWVKNVLYFRRVIPSLFRGHRLTIIMCTFLIIGLFSQYDPNILGSGHHSIENILHSDNISWKVLSIFFILKFFSVSLSYSSGVSGGLFMPTLLIGAILGHLYGMICQFFYLELDLNLAAFSLVGMGAYFAAVIRAPFTSILMVFELTRNYNIILPLMMANVTAYILSKKFHDGSIYESISEQDGVHLPCRDDHDILESMIVEDTMIVDVISLSAKLPVSEAIKILKKDRMISGYPIVQNGLLTGMITANEILKAYAKEEKTRLIREIAEKRIITIYPDQSLLIALHKLKFYGVSRLPVVSRINDKNLLGIITAKNIIKQFGLYVKEEELVKDQEQDLIIT